MIALRVKSYDEIETKEYIGDKENKNGKYLSIECKLESGKFGEVHLASYGNRKLVIKTVPIDKFFKKEVNALLKLKHPNIIKMFNFKKDQNTIFLEYASYGDLYNNFNKYIDKNLYFSEIQVKKIIYRILLALEYAYNLEDFGGISHRDVKMENVFISSDKNVKLGDWGLAAFNVRNRKCKRKCGTKGNYSPQMLSEKFYDSNISDVWALGVMIFSLITNNRPYQQDIKFMSENNYSDDWLNKILKKEWKIWWKSHENFTPIIKDRSFFFKDLIENMLNPTEIERFSLEEVRNHQWFDEIKKV